MCCELARISAHLLGLGAFAMDVGAVTVFLLTFTEREKIYNLVEAAYRRAVHDQLHAHRRRDARHAAGLVRSSAGNSSKNLPSRSTKSKRCSRATASGWIACATSAVISKEMAIDYGLSGPNLRGSGIEWDLRKNQPYLCYKDLEFDIPIGSVGDCYDRYLVRMEEMRQSMRILQQCVDKIPGGAENKSKEPVNIADGKSHFAAQREGDDEDGGIDPSIHARDRRREVPPGEVYFGHENPKGELGFYINSKGGGVPYRLKIRAPSFVNLSILGELMPGHMISDVVAILGSLDFVMGECDR